MASDPMPYTPADADEVAALWNEEFGGSFPLRAELLRCRWQPGPDEPAIGLVTRQGEHITGALLARLPSLPWFPAGVGFVTLFVVRRSHRQRGLGRALVEAVTEEARRHGFHTLVFGGGPGHLLPGIPLEAPLATWRFLRRAGATPREVFHDLLVDLELPLPTIRWPEGARLEPIPREEMLAFLAREFPGEWEVDVAAAYAAGGTVLGVRSDGSLVGFVAVHHPGLWPPAPSLFWANALPGAVGGVGPLGIAAAFRTRGLGLAMVRGALAWLQQAGVRWAVIDWTDLTTFYGKLGAHIWRTYQMVALPLERTRSTV